MMWTHLLLQTTAGEKIKKNHRNLHCLHRYLFWSARLSERVNTDLNCISKGCPVYPGQRLHCLIEYGNLKTERSEREKAMFVC